MFFNASSFTSDLSEWQTGNVTNMDRMFEDADSMYSNLPDWYTTWEDNRHRRNANNSRNNG